LEREEKPMIPYQKEKIGNAICFFALEHRQKSGQPLTQTYLYKYLAFVDFLSVEKIGVPAFGLEYRAMPRGPVPPSIYNKRHYLKTELFEFKKEAETIYFVIPKKHPNLDYFSAFELALMRRLISIHATKYSSTNEISDHSHKRITAWKRTFEKQENDFIDYSLQFDGDIMNKKEDELTPAEENYLTYLAMKGTAKCR
jgi:uncharacterized phage-associated protein